MKYEYLSSETFTIKGFSRMPNELFNNPELKKLSSDAKILITLLLDKVTLSIQNNLIDGNGHPYVLFSAKKIMNILNISKNTVTKRLNELEEAGLIICPDRSKGKEEFRIYVTDFFHQTSSSSTSPLKESQKSGSRSTNHGKEESQIMGKSAIPNNNILNNNQTERNQTTTESVADTATRELFKAFPNISNADIQAVVKEANGDLDRCRQAIATIPSAGANNAVGFLISSIRYGWNPPIPHQRNKTSYPRSSGYKQRTYDFSKLQKFIDES